MPKFMDVHEGFVGVTAAQFQAAHERDLAIQADEGVSLRPRLARSRRRAGRSASRPAPISMR